MVRVAGLQEYVDAGIDKPREDGRSPAETIAAIGATVREQTRRQTACLDGELRPALAEHGIRIQTCDEVDRAPPRGARRALPAPDLPRPDAARGRPRPSVPVHLQPLALARRARARPADRAGDLRAREGAEGDAAALRAGRRRAHVRAARGPDRRAPRHALPGHGDRRLRRLPRHARRRLHGRRRGRRPAARGRGRSCAGAASARSCASRSAPA